MGRMTKAELIAAVLAASKQGKDESAIIAELTAKADDSIDRELVAKQFAQFVNANVNAKDVSDLAQAENKLRELRAKVAEQYAKAIEGAYANVKDAKPTILDVHYPHFEDCKSGTFFVGLTFNVYARERAKIVHDAGYKRPSGFSPIVDYPADKLTEKQGKMRAALLTVGAGKDGLYHNEQARAAYKIAFGEERATNFDFGKELPFMQAVYSEDTNAA